MWRILKWMKWERTMTMIPLLKPIETGLRQINLDFRQRKEF
jgi:hypothetical protein